MHKFRIFDFDDTIVATDSTVFIIGPHGEKKLTSAEFANYKMQPGERMDKSRYDNRVINPRIIDPYMKLMRSYLNVSDYNVMILTARPNAKPIAKYLRSIGITSGLKIVALNSTSADDKKHYIEKLILKGANDIEFYDDRAANIAAVNTLMKKYPQVNIRTERVPRL